MTEKSYIQMLEESLYKKRDILRNLQVLCHEQEEILLDEKAEADAFEKNVEQKAALIERLEKLDQGFEQVFSRVEEELQSNKELYKENILHMQECIREMLRYSSRRRRFMVSPLQRSRGLPLRLPRSCTLRDRSTSSSLPRTHTSR